MIDHEHGRPVAQEWMPDSGRAPGWLGVGLALLLAGLLALAVLFYRLVSRLGAP